jgi:hypothetical protein
LTYIAKDISRTYCCSAGLQQFKQAALAYVLLAAADRPLDAGQVAAAAEAVLQQRLQLQVCFNVDEALAELRRFGLLVEQLQGLGPNAAAVVAGERQQEGLGQQEGLAQAAATVAAAGATRRPAAAVVGASSLVTSAAEPAAAVAGQTVQQQQQHVLYRVLDSREAQQVLQQYWAGLLRQRVRSILRDV